MEKEIIEYVKYGVWILFGSGIIFEITPIKFSPISMFLNWLGKKMNGDMKEELSHVKDEVKTVKEEVKTVSTDLQEHIVESQRRHILDFADELGRGEPKSKENFTNIIQLHDKYDKYIESNHLENGQVDLAFIYISKRYQECLENNNFYTGK